MPFYKTDDLQAWTGGTWTNLGADKKPDIHGFSNDSRNMEKDFAPQEAFSATGKQAEATRRPIP